MFSRSSVFAISVIIASLAAGQILPNSIQMENAPDGQNNVFEHSIRSGLTSSDLESHDLHTRHHSSIKCGAVCGTPPSADCHRLVKGLDRKGPKVCAPNGDAHLITNANCEISLGHRQDQTECIAPSLFVSLGKELVKTCVDSQGLGGCVTVPGNPDVAVCMFFQGKICFLDDLGL